MKEGGDITIEDLQEQHRGYAKIVGIDKLIKLSEVYGGTQIYIPKKDELLKNKKYRAISEEFDGSNIKALAKKYQVSESTVYRIVREQLIKPEGRQVPGQHDLFEYIK